MRKSLRLLAIAAALNVTTGTGAAVAQTVLVRHARPAETVELMLNATKVATATTDAAGDTTLPLDLRANNAGKTEIDANIFIDTCDKLHRVIVVERGQPIATQEPGCERRDIAGLYWVRRVNTLVIDVGGANPTMMLVKGEYGLEPERVWGAPGGLVVFGGGGLTAFRDATQIFCGTASPCGGNSGIAYTAGATLWLKRWIGVEGSYLQPRKPTATGSGTNYSFDSELDVRLATVAGVVGIPIGPVRLYGKGGSNFHYAKATTKNTIDGALQTLEVQTQGWGWLFGGGLEVWMAPAVGLYADAGFVGLKGAAIGGGEVRLDDRMRYLIFGMRVHIGR
jgi:hypothetical protein